MPQRLRPSVAALAAACALVLSSCAYANSGRPPTQTQPAPGASVTVTAEDDLAARVPASIKEAGVLRFATEASYPPMEFIADDELTIAGADVDLGNAIAEVLGLEGQWVNATFTSLVPGVADGTYPAAMSALTITQPRLAEVTMVSYLNTGTSWGVAAGNPDEVDPTSPCGVVVAVQSGTVQEDQLGTLSAACEEAGSPPVQIQGYALESDVYQAVIDGAAQALTADTPVVAYAASESAGAIEVVGDVSDPGLYGIALPKSETQFAGLVAEAIAKLIADGTYSEILDAWNLSDSAITTPEVNPAP